MMWRILAVWAGTALAVTGSLWFLDVFTWHALAYALFLAGPGDLRWPLGTRLFILAVLLEVAVAVTARLVWREAQLECATHRDLWLAAHISLVHRVHRRVTWWIDGAKVAVEQHRAHRPVTVSNPVSTVSSAPVDAVSTDRKAA